MVKWKALEIHAIILLICRGLRASTPSGYQGCYRGTQADLEDLHLKVFNKNTGEKCKKRCVSEDLRYAGTGGPEGNVCACFDDLERYDGSNGCDSVCSGDAEEICGGRLICATRPCKNNASCQDINSRTYECTCKAGWTGSDCTEQTESLSAVVYISVPVVIVVFVIVTVTALLIWRRRHHQRMKHSNDLRNTSTLTPATQAVDNQAYTGNVAQDKTAPQYSNNDLIVSQDQYSEINLNTKCPEEKDLGMDDYNTTDKKHKGFQKANHDYEYSHLRMQSNECIDTTYSHLVEKDGGNINNGASDTAYAGAFTSTIQSNKVVFKSDADYNKLHTSKSFSTSNGRVRTDLEDESVYDHAVAGGDDQMIKQAAEYSHLHEV